MTDIHGYEGRLRSVEKLIDRENPISHRNAELLKSFEKQLLLEGLSVGRVVKYLHHLRVVAEMLRKDFDEATRADIEEIIGRIERNSRYSPFTKKDFKVAIKRLYKWLKGGNEDYPEEVKWIKTTLKAKDRLLPEELLTEDEVMRLVGACDNPRDRAFVMSLYESGARIGELGSLRIRDVVFLNSTSATRILYEPRILLQGKSLLCSPLFDFLQYFRNHLGDSFSH